MNESSPSESLSKLALNTSTNNRSCNLDVQMELVSEEEMASIEAALTAASSSLVSCAAPAIASPSFKRNTRSYESSPSESLSKLVLNTPTNKGSCSADIQMELVSEDEMASIEASLGATPPSISSIAGPAIASPSRFQRNARSIPSKTKRRLSYWDGLDIEDFEMKLVSEDEMASIEAALGATRSSPAIASPSQFQRNMRSYESSPSESLSKLALNTQTNSRSCSVGIQMELVREEEMASIEAALAATPSSLSSIATPPIVSPFRFWRNTKSIPSKTKRRLSFWARDFGSHRSTEKKSREADSFFHRFRSKTGLYVSDVTAAEWCEKQVEFVLLSCDRDTSKATAAHGPRQAKLEGEEWREERLKSAVRGKLQTTARRAGRTRHKKLAEEVVEEVEFLVKSKEDSWALKLLNFILAAHQLLTEGFTREPLLISFFDNIWMVGKVDEIRMPETKTYRNPIILDIKTRERNTLPTEAQKRKNRLQLMCYKYMWDNMVADNFPSKHFFDFFSLRPHSVLSDEIRQRAADSGFLIVTLDDMVKLYRSTCRVLPPAHDQLLLRYEYQKDHSLLGEDQFAFDCDWLKSRIRSCLEFWLGEREASYTSQEERWKCRYCKFASSICPANADLE